MTEPVDLDKERRIQGHLEKLAKAIQSDPRAAHRACEILNEEESVNMKEIEMVPIRIPKELVDRAEVLWGRLLDTPELRSAPPRRSAAAAVRLALLKGLELLEGPAKKKGS